MNQNTAAIILAAGKGTRMKSSMPKVMHKIAGLPMIDHVIRSCMDAAINNITVIVGADMGALTSYVAPHKTAIQEKQLGTGDAVKAAKESLKNFDGMVFILCGDAPFITAKTLTSLQNAATKTGLSVLGFETSNPSGYGRFIIKNNIVTEIVEEKDCTDEQRQITICNGGAYCVDGKRLFQWLDKLSNNNAQSEYYLTDLIAIAAKDNVACAYTIADKNELIGINSRTQLADAESILQNHLRQNAMNNGVTMIDPSSVYLCVDTKFGQDVIIEPNVFIGAGVTIGNNTKIFAFSHIEGATIGNDSEIGPFARIRPKSKIGNHVSVGNFIEVNRSEFKDGSKSKHLSYIGDAIIGEKTNIGAGTVFANYDGFNKHISTTGNGTFVGSNSTIISPVNIGDGAMIAAGSTITKDVAPNALAITRVNEAIIDGWATQYRKNKKKD